MKGLVKTQKGVGYIALQDVPEPAAQVGEVKIKVAACGVCGTDIHVWHDSFPYWPPVILGHELTGTIVEVGPECQRANRGDRVVVEPHTQACGHCHLCRTGNIQICAKKRSPGWGIDGGMAEYICYPEKLLHKIPDSVSWDQAVVVEPTANIVTDLLERTTVTAGDFVVVQGPGPIGLTAAMAARAAGARQVAILGTPDDVAWRFKIARDLGFETLINVVECNAVDAIMDLTAGQGADSVVECSGSVQSIPLTVELVRKLGKICVIGLTGNQKVELDWDKFSFKVATVVFNLSTSYTSWDKTISLIDTGQIQAEKLITHNERLVDWHRLFQAFEVRTVL